MVLKKCREQPDDILFIDASNGFLKVKNQNVLRDENVDRIVNTYLERKPVAKYAAVASLRQVRENDYNLNIPRYVDTFEAEEHIDLNKVADELADLRTRMDATQKTIAAFCAELNIKAPF